MTTDKDKNKSKNKDKSKPEHDHESEHIDIEFNDETGPVGLAGNGAFSNSEPADEAEAPYDRAQEHIDIDFNQETGPVGLAANNAFTRSVSEEGAEAGAGKDYSTDLVNGQRPFFSEIPLRAMPTQYGERMRKLRTEILLRHGYHNAAPLVFAIVSPSSGDGRSFLAAELAVAFAQLGRATLLIDTDMRNPQHRRFFWNQPKVGLAQALETGATPEFSQVAGLNNLSVLDAGSEPGFNPTELLSSKRFYGIVNSMQNLFSFIIIDTPAFNKYTDATVVSTIVGRVLTLHRSPANTFSETRAMLDSLSRSGTEVIGGVLNHF